MHSTMHCTKAPNATQNWISRNGICGNSDHKYAFARIPYITKHKAALCLNFKFLPKKNIVKKLYIFFKYFFEKIWGGEPTRKYHGGILLLGCARGTVNTA